MPVFDRPPPLASGRYTLSQTLGEGGMATVYGGFDTMLEVERAVKVLSPALCRNEKLKKRFLAEARAMAKLRHNNIVTVFDVGMEGDVPYIVMEMIQGGSIIDLINNRGVQGADVAGPILLGVLAGLQASHDKGIIHRDIKPHNVLLTLDGEPKITDFGIANMTEDERSMTKTGAVMGTLAYMPPEQRHSAKGLGPTADIFAAGATLFAILTGREPFDLYNTSLQEKLFEGVPEGLRDIIIRACSYEPANRYQSASAMGNALRAALLSMGVDLTTDNRVPMSSGEEGTVYSDGLEGASAPAAAREQTTINPKETWFTTAGERLDGVGFPATDVSGDSSHRLKIGVMAAFAALLVVSAMVVFGLDDGDSIPRTQSPPVAPESQQSGNVSTSAEEPVESIPEVTKEEPAVAAVPVELPERPDKPIETAPPPEKKTTPPPTPTPVPVKEVSVPDPKPVTPPPPVEAAPAPPVPAPAAEPGKLSVNSKPPSTVTIGGRSLGKWVRGVSLDAGTHRVVLTTDSGQTKVLPTRIESGKSTVLCWSFELNAVCPPPKK